MSQSEILLWQFHGNGKSNGILNISPFRLDSLLCTIIVIQHKSLTQRSDLKWKDVQFTDHSFLLQSQFEWRIFMIRHTYFGMVCDYMYSHMNWRAFEYKFIYDFKNFNIHDTFFLNKHAMIFPYQHPSCSWGAVWKWCREFVNCLLYWCLSSLHFQDQTIIANIILKVKHPTPPFDCNGWLFRASFSNRNSIEKLSHKS